MLQVVESEYIYLFFSPGKFCMSINKEQIFLSSQFESM